MKMITIKCHIYIADGSSLVGELTKTIGTFGPAFKAVTGIVIVKGVSLIASDLTLDPGAD